MRISSNAGFLGPSQRSHKFERRQPQSTAIDSMYRHWQHQWERYTLVVGKQS